MEVHKHPHDVMHKKKWGEYFLEFLMIFLAVFLGFLTENWREHSGDRRKEKEFMQSILKDIKTDVTLNRFRTKLRLKKLTASDTLMNLLNNLESDSTQALYYYARKVLSPLNPYTYNHGSIDQLKNAGGLRLLHSKFLLDTLQNYYYSIEFLKQAQEIEQSGLEEYRDLLSNVFVAKVFISMYDSTAGFDIHRPAGNPKLLSRDPMLINKICFKLHLWQKQAFLVNIQGERLNDIGENLIRRIQNEYKLD